ncbi:MAG: Putative helicase [Edwardsiella phage MSW-3]|nr:MAG: Putative helicase [Edwardsiella phage MSW-3]
MQLRPYQQEAYDGIGAAWHNVRNVLAVLPTGAGKTVLFSSILAAQQGATCAIAHRQELVSQISLALARNGVRHRIIGPVNVVKNIVRIHMDELGASFYDPNSRHAVAGVDTLIRRQDNLSAWLKTVTCWVIDEAHHVIRDNKWGTAVNMFPNARGLGVTATPCRADGCGLGAHADGVFERMIIGPTMRDLINMKFLTEYRIFAPPSTFSRSSVEVSATTGDFKLDQMRSAIASSSLVTHDEKTVTGDIVEHYKRIAPGKLGVTFVPDIKTADEVASQFNAAGVPAAVVSSKTPDIERAGTLRKFKNRELLQLVNVDLFGEGFDLPAIEVVSMGRPTESYGLYVQQFGRALRLLPGKTHAIIIDHVGNVVRHGLPDASREWSLDRREKRSSSSDAPTLRICHGCSQPFERFLVTCPYCGEPIPTPGATERRGPEQVDGDLMEIDPTTLEQMRAAFDKVNMPAAEYHQQLSRQGVPQIGIMANVKRHVARQETAAELRDVLAWWAGHRRAEGLQDREIYRKFYLKYGTDFLTAQTGKIDEMTALMQRVKGDM